MTKTDNIRLIVLTPQQTLFEGFVEKVELPGEKGRFMVLSNHAPIISSLVAGNVAFVSADQQESLAVKTGFVRVNNNEVIVCAEV